MDEIFYGRLIRMLSSLIVIWEYKWFYGASRNGVILFLVFYELDTYKLFHEKSEILYFRDDFHGFFFLYFISMICYIGIVYYNNFNIQGLQ